MHETGLHDAYYSQKSNTHVETSEKKPCFKLKKNRFVADGYDNKTNTIYEYYGCYWHGCPKCHPNNKEKYNRTMERRQMLMDTGYKMCEMWEHDWLDIKQNDLGISQREYVEQSARNQTIVTRAALFGGRTEAFKSYHECNEDEEIHYYDVTSLYPTVNALDEHPIGFRRYRPITGKTVSDTKKTSL